MFIRMETPQLPHSRWCAYDEPFEDRPVKGEHTSSGVVEAKEFVGVPIPQEEVQSGAHRCGDA